MSRLSILVAVAVLSLAGEAVAQCVDPPTGLIAWWSGDGHSFDTAGSHHGTLIGDASYGTGMVQQAFSFDGAQNFVRVPDSTDWDFGTGDLTIDLWVRFDVVQNSMFIHQMQGTAAGGFEFDYQANLLVFAVSQFNVGIQRAWEPVADTWYLVAVTRTGDNFRLYVDGIQLGSEEVESAPLKNVGGPLQIGIWQQDASWQMNGQIDELEIFDRALSASEIQAIFDAGSDGKCKSTVPAVSTWGMMVMVLLLLAAGTLVMTRRRSATG